MRMFTSPWLKVSNPSKLKCNLWEYIICAEIKVSQYRLEIKFNVCYSVLVGPLVLEKEIVVGFDLWYSLIICRALFCQSTEFVKIHDGKVFIIKPFKVCITPRIPHPHLSPHLDMLSNISCDVDTALDLG